MRLSGEYSVFDELIQKMHQVEAFYFDSYLHLGGGDSRTKELEIVLGRIYKEVMKYA